MNVRGRFLATPRVFHLYVGRKPNSAAVYKKLKVDCAMLTSAIPEPVPESPTLEHARYAAAGITVAKVMAETTKPNVMPQSTAVLGNPAESAAATFSAALANHVLLHGHADWTRLLVSAEMLSPEAFQKLGEVARTTAEQMLLAGCSTNLAAMTVLDNLVHAGVVSACTSAGFIDLLRGKTHASPSLRQLDATVRERVEHWSFGPLLVNHLWVAALDDLSVPHEAYLPCQFASLSDLTKNALGDLLIHRTFENGRDAQRSLDALI